MNAAGDADRLAAILVEAAEREIMPRFCALEPDRIRTKSGPLDVVTEADEAAERMITARLEALYPGIVVVGEEAASADPAILDRLAGAALAAVVDPVDGTANFATSLPLFGCMAALIRDGEVVASAIHSPVTGDTAVAEAGGGAWMRGGGRPDRRLQVAPPAPVPELTGKAGPRHFGDRAAMLSVRLLGLLGTWDYRCAAHEYRMLADGHCHFSLYSSMMPWDHLPGVLLHREAGGVARCLDAGAYGPDRRTGGLLCAPDDATWTALRAALFD